MIMKIILPEFFTHSLTIAFNEYNSRRSYYED